MLLSFSKNFHNPAKKDLDLEDLVDFMSNFLKY